MIQRGQYNEAFTKALMASDLPVVIDLLEMVDQSKIFLPTGDSTLEGKRQNFNSAESDNFSSPSPTSITTTEVSRSTLTPSPPTMIAPPPVPPPPPPPPLAPTFQTKKITAPIAPPKPLRSIVKLSKNGYYADSEASLDRRKLRKSRPEADNAKKYEKFASDLISGADDFFSTPNRPISRNHTRTRTTPNRPTSRIERPLSGRHSCVSELESDTETRLEQFFLMNKYWVCVYYWLNNKYYKLSHFFREKTFLKSTDFRKL